MIPRSRMAVVTAIAGLVLTSAAPASADHFRASSGGVSYNGSGELTWTIASAWRKDHVDEFVADPADIIITDSNGNPTAVTNATPTNTSDQSNPLFAISYDAAPFDISSLLGTPGTYEAFATTCCRPTGVV